MLTLEFVTQFVYEHCENVKVSKNGTHFLARCPICHDSKKSKSKRRFNLDFNEGNPIYHCWNCGSSGSFLSIYSKLKGISISEALKELRGFNPDYLIQKLSKRKRDKVLKEIEYENFNYILSDCITYNEKVDSYIKSLYQRKLNSFIKERCIPPNKVFMAYKGEYQGMYIIPIYDSDNNIIYFQARSSDASIKPKYKNPTLKKGNIIFNKHLFERSKYIIICEGLLDAISIGNQGTSCLGKEISSKFLKELQQLTDMGIIIALDNDKSGLESMISILKNVDIPFNIKFFLFPYKHKKYKDINELIVNENINNIYEYVVNNSYNKTTTYTKIKTVKWIKEKLN